MLQALRAEDEAFGLSSMPAAVVTRAIADGFGPILARLTPVAARGAFADAIEAADLTARLLTADMLDAVTDILRRSSEAGYQVALLKGCSTCVRYYPEPHLRTMGDVDVMVSAADLPGVEALVASLGFVDTTATPPRAWYEQHHHSIPLWNPQRRLWLEIHTRLYPPSSPLASEERFRPEAIALLMDVHRFNGHEARALSHELQLVYTATRWAGMPSLQRGAFPVLDATLLLAKHGTTLNWPQVCSLVEGTWGVTALHLMLTSLDRWQLAAVPSPVLQRLAAADRFTNAAVIGLLHRLTTSYVMEGRPLGGLFTSRVWRTTWSTLVGPTPALTKPLQLAKNLTFPVSDGER